MYHVHSPALRDVFLISEYVKGGSLHHLLHKEEVRVDHELSVQWAMEVADGNLYC